MLQRFATVTMALPRRRPLSRAIKGQKRDQYHKDERSEKVEVKVQHAARWTADSNRSAHAAAPTIAQR